jgi:hypothetical protein
MSLRSYWHGRLRACLLAFVVVMGALCPKPAHAHGSEFVYVRLQSLDAHANTWAIRASIEYLDNPLAPDEAAARQALAGLFTVAPPDAAQKNAFPQKRPSSLVLEAPQWIHHTTWDDASVPVPMPEAMADGREHRWLTALWTLKLPSEAATACLRINADTKLSVVWWEVKPMSATLGDATRWQILLPGDRSFVFGVPEASASSPSTALETQHRPLWARVILPSMLGAVTLIAVVAASTAWARRRSRHVSKAEPMAPIAQA